MSKPSSKHLKAGLVVSQVSVLWSVSVSVTAVAIGIADGSLVLIAFGLTGLLDGAGSVALTLSFRHARTHEVISPRRERVALRLVSIGLIAVGVSTSAESFRRLLTHHETKSSLAGIVISAASVIVLGVLSVIKRRVARKLASNALRADGWLSATGAALGGIAVAGTTLGSASTWWADSAAALIVAIVAATIGLIELRRVMAGDEGASSR